MATLIAPWIEGGLSEAQVRWVRRVSDPSGMCQVASQRLLERMLRSRLFAGCEMSLVEGRYGRSYHVWLEVGGVVVDPTAYQFCEGGDVGEIDPRLYHGRRRWSDPLEYEGYMARRLMRRALRGVL